MIGDDRRLLLAARRERLIERAASQRDALAVAIAPLAQAAVWLERGLRLGQCVRQRPGWVLVPALLWLWWRPHGLLRAVSGASTLWRVLR